MLSCVQTTRCPRRCSRCHKPLAGREAHLPVFRAGIYCPTCCPVCRPDPADTEDEADFEEENK
jgi:hypothetical protein